MVTRSAEPDAIFKEAVEAIQLYRSAKESGQPFDAVILDLTVPGAMGGKEAIEKLRELDSSVKAIVSSGYSNDPIMSEYKRYGFSGVVAKPFNMQNIGEALNAILDWKPSLNRE